MLIKKKEYAFKQKKGYAKEGSNVLLSTAKFISPREILHFKRSNQNIWIEDWIEMFYSFLP